MAPPEFAPTRAMSQPFHPPVRTLMGPGPSSVHPRVSAALSRPTIGHLDPSFIALMDDIRRQLQLAFRTRNEVTLPISAPGSAGMEACFVNLVEPGDKVVVCRNGVFGGRMVENVQRIGAEAVIVDHDWGAPVDPQRLHETLAAHRDARVVAMVHAETSTGVCSDVAALCAVAREFGCLTIVDAVTSLGGMAVDVDGWEADAVYSGTQKCLSCPPGLSPVTFSPRAMDAVASRTQPVQSWFLDLKLVTRYWGEGSARAYHHTAPVHALYALHEALVMLHEEGLEASWARHARMHALLRDGLEALGIGMFVDRDHRLPMLNAVTIPEGVDDAGVRGRLLEEFNLEIGPGLGPLQGRIWRIGLMGNGAREQNVLFCLSALARVLGR